jgi:hypothetical protein
MQIAKKATATAVSACLFLLITAAGASAAVSGRAAAAAFGVSARATPLLGEGITIAPTPHSFVPDARAANPNSTRQVVAGPVRVPADGSLVSDARALSTSARRASSPSSAIAVARLGHVALLEQAGASLIEANSVLASSRSRCVRGAPSLSALGSRFDGLTIAGRAIGSRISPNSVVPLSVGGLPARLVLNEQIRTATGLTVTMIHATVFSPFDSRSVLEEVRIGQAQTTVTCGAAARTSTRSSPTLATAPGSSTAAGRVSAAATSAATADFSGYATGTVLHADALQSGTTRLVDVEEAFSGASVDSRGLGATIQNEMVRTVQGALSGKNAFGRGTGLEVGLVVGPTTDNQLILAGKAEATALPEGELVSSEIALPASPFAYASLLRAQALAQWENAESCFLGGDVSRGLGFAADVQLLNLGATNPDGSMVQPLVASDATRPARAVSQSLSHTFVTPQVDKDGKRIGTGFGLASEVRQTISPVTFFEGGPSEFTIELLGEWVLRASAGGIANTAVVHYGPLDESPQTPILRIIQGTSVSTLLTFQQFFTSQGLVIKIPGVAEIAIGEDPRAIGGDDESQPTTSGDGTTAAAAVDVLRVKLLEQKDGQGNVTARAADLRLGHMETRAQVPAGGLACDIPVTKVPNPASVSVGNTFTTTITVLNPFDCDLTNVRLVDVITTKLGARFAVEGTAPKASQLPSGANLPAGTVIWNDIGPIPLGKSKTVTLTLRAQGSGGEILDIATATGTLSKCKGSGAAVVGSASAIEGAKLKGISRELRVPVAAVLGVKLPATGVGVPMALSLALLGLAVLGYAALRRAR